MRFSMARMSRAAVACALPLAMTVMASSAFAQKAGTYTGTNNEGDEVQVAVATVSGSLAVTGMSDGGAVYCSGQQAATYGVAIGLSGQPIVNKKATVDVLAVNLYYLSNLTFKGDMVSGTIDFAVPIFNGTRQPPKKACAAKTMKQTFTATFGGTALHAPPAGTARAMPQPALK